MLENHLHDCRNCNKVRFILLGIIVSYRAKAIKTWHCHGKTLKINMLFPCQLETSIEP